MKSYSKYTVNSYKADIIEFLNGKTSKTGYIKDILRLHMQIEQSYLANGVSVEQSVSCETIKEESKVNDDFDFDLSDLNL